MPFSNFWTLLLWFTFPVKHTELYVTMYWSNQLISNQISFGCDRTLKDLLQFLWWNLGLTHYQTTNFRLFQTERVCRRQFQIWQKWPKAIQTGRKHWEKEKLLVTSNFSFSHSVFKRLVSLRHQKVSLCGNGLTLSQTIAGFYVSAIQVFWKHCGKRRNCL